MTDLVLGGVRAFVNVLRIVAGVLLLLSVTLNFVNVIARYFFNASFHWAEESMLFLMVGCVFLGNGVVSWTGRQIRMDVIVGMMPLGSEIKFSGPGFLMEKKAIGCMYGSTRFREHMPKLIELFLKGRLDLSSLVSQRLPLTDVNHAFELMKGGKVART